MENHQPKSSQIPLTQNDYSQSEAPQLQIQRMDSQYVDCMISSLIDAEIPPFVVTKDYKIRREQQTPEPESDPECNNIQEKILGYNRKDKSLMELTRKFIHKFEGAPSNILVLDQVTVELNVQRRRIYDIINIMESLCVVSKIRKNVYEWKGLRKAIQTIEAYSQGDWLEDSQKCKKQKSLESLSTEFLKLFSQRKSYLTLEEATQIILNESNQHVKKTKIRRLYDIVNVFKCLGLVEKVKNHKNLGGKPVYQWLGCQSLLKIIEEKQKNFGRSQYHEQIAQSASQQDNQNGALTKLQSANENIQIQNSNILVNSIDTQNKFIKSFKPKQNPFGDISNLQNVMNRGNINRRNSVCEDKTASKMNPQLKKRSSFTDTIKNKIIETSKVSRNLQNGETTHRLELASTNSSSFMDDQYCQGPSFFHNLYKHLSNEGKGSISQVHSRLTEIMWPNHKNQA